MAGNCSLGCRVGSQAFKNLKGNAMSKTVLDGLRFVLQNMRLQEGQMAKVQADIVAQAIIEIETLDQHIEKLETRELVETR
jgi:hypothetical protein